MPRLVRDEHIFINLGVVAFLSTSWVIFDISAIWMNLAVCYAVMEYHSYSQFSVRRKELSLVPPVLPSSLDSPFSHFALEKLLQEPKEDLYLFFLYSFYGKKTETLKRDVIGDFLKVNFHVADEKVEGAITRFEEILGFLFTPKETVYSPQLRCPETEKSKGWRFGASRMASAFYHPLVIRFLMRLFTFLGVQLLKLCGFSVHPAKGPYLVQYYVYQPCRHRWWMAKIDGRKELPGCCQYKAPPLLMLHGFGIGLLYYVPQILLMLLSTSWFFSKPQKPRSIIIVEMQWIGLFPHGNFDLKRCPLQPELVREIMSFLVDENLVSSSAMSNAKENQNVFLSDATECVFFQTTPATTPTVSEEDSEEELFVNRREETNSYPSLVVDVFAQSYGTTIASLMHRTYPNMIRRCILFDPVCFLPQFTKKAQLTQLHPFEVIHLPDDGEENFSLLFILGRFIFRAQLIIMWMLSFREIGTIWTTCRQLQGCEYIDRGHLLSLEENLMVVMGGSDSLVASRAVKRLILNTSKRVKISIVEGAPHAACIYYPSQINETLAFFSVTASSEGQK